MPVSGMIPGIHGRIVQRCADQLREVQERLAVVSFIVANYKFSDTSLRLQYIQEKDMLLASVSDLDREIEQACKLLWSEFEGYKIEFMEADY